MRPSEASKIACASAAVMRLSPVTSISIESLISIHPVPAKITIITLFEFLYGILEKSPKNIEKLRSFINNFSVLNTTEKTADLLARLKYKYEKQGLLISLSDLLIASLVIESNMTLLTRDTDFEKIEELNKVILISQK